MNRVKENERTSENRKKQVSKQKTPMQLKGESEILVKKKLLGKREREGGSFAPWAKRSFQKKVTEAFFV